MSEYLDVDGINQRIAAFDKRHGASIYDDAWIRFEDGACREVNPLGSLLEPPTDPYDRARRRAVYHKIIFERALREFDNAKRNYRSVIHANLNSPVCGPAPECHDALSELNTLKAAALAAKAKYDKAQAAVEAAKPEATRAREQQDQINRESNQNLLNAIDNVEL